MNKDFVNKRLEGEGRVWNRDYSKDGIIEASAGTGKTYTLQSIVLKLLTEKQVSSVKNLLLVTYTEKAAGELKDRIRDILEKADCLPPDFDEVTICTIHSFCRELLSEYAFENRVPMQMEIGGSDRELKHQAILAALHSEEFRLAQGARFVELMTAANLTAEKLVAEVEKDFSSPELLPETIKKSEGKGKPKIQVPDGKAILMNALKPIAQRLFKEMKAKESAMSFDDLVERTHDVVVAEARKEESGETSAFLDSVRHQYRIALVDEFQDTDTLQWEIFRNIFSHRVNRIAAGPEPKQGSLLVVGDPKQAIYSFRGADIGAYIGAKREITGGDEKKAMTLGTTYRSSPKLVEAFNRVFGAKHADDPSWFENMTEGGGRISYASVDTPSKSDKFNEIDYHSGFGNPVELLESLPCQPSVEKRAGYGNKTICLPTFLRNAACEMKRLKSLSPAYTVVNPKTQEKESHCFSYRDMCILVRGHADAETARKILAEANIPFSIYKEQGLYASAEAESLLALFDFLARPSRRGRLEALLLTPLFGCRPDQLADRLAHDDREFSRLMDVWQELISRKAWCQFFEHVMNDTLLAHPRPDDADFDRRWSATRQILDSLLHELGRRAQAISEFAETLRSWRQKDQRAGENGALRYKESEADCVQIMTMHVSKGLEFPVVFVAWGFGLIITKGTPKAKEGRLILEEKRLLYVALTRAEHKLYLPWSQWAQHQRRITKTDKKTKEKVTTYVDETGLGSVGSGLLIKAGEKNTDLGFLARGIRALFEGDEAAKKTVMQVSARIANADAGDETQDEPVAGGLKTVTVYELPKGELARQHLTNESYSTVHKASAHGVEPIVENTVEDESHIGLTEDRKKLPTLLPRNNISGDVFHEIMETLCGNDDSDGTTPGFCTVGRAAFADLEKEGSPLQSLIVKVMRRHQLASRKDEQGGTTERTLTRMVWHALNVPIAIGGRKFCLKDIPATDRRAELEFVVNRALMLGDALPAADDPQRDSAFNGKIDLLIRPEGKDGPIYVLDWKTNSLADYSCESLARAMTASDYHLQYQFYSQAVRSWLPGTELGGVAYLFVRAGEQSEKPEGDSGVFVAPAEAITQEACRAAIKEAVK